MAVNAAVSEDSLFIPLIDFSLFLHGSEDDKLSVARSMTDGFKNAGFVYIKNHGVPTEIITRVFSESAKFFARPQEQKDGLSWTTPEANRGYTRQGREKTTNLEDKAAIDELRAAIPDLKESMEIGKEGEPRLPNRWPDDKEGEVFKRVMQDFFGICRQLHTVVMRSVGLGMGLDEGFFDQYTDGGDNTLRLLHYPSVHKDVFSKNKGQVRAGDHSDYGSITFLFQDDRGGLQVLSPKGTFVDATPIPGTIVINAGDLLARWSNGMIRSTRHRVVEPPTAPSPESDIHPPRYSVAYFCNPNFDRFIDALPGTFEKDGKMYPGVYSGEYLVKRLAATY